MNERGGDQNNELARFGKADLVAGRREYDEAIVWYADQSSETFPRWLQGFEQAIASLASLPGIHPIAPESQHLKRRVRRLLYRPFRLLYFVAEPADGEPGTVFITSVRHGAARPYE
jgi:hypothetical protein